MIKQEQVKAGMVVYHTVLNCKGTVINLSKVLSSSTLVDLIRDRRMRITDLVYSNSASQNLQLLLVIPHNKTYVSQTSQLGDGLGYAYWRLQELNIISTLDSHQKENIDNLVSKLSNLGENDPNLNPNASL
jgi:hypothetical protein